MLEEQLIICRRCGFQEFVAPDKRKRADQLCRDCRVRPAKTINYGLEKSCIPHQGEFDSEDNPVEWGHLFMPGNRKCGHRDCIQPAHIV